nr:ras-associated and pleckstrin homology domains-containing protein 1-like [Misgurnus anguillicaudatus]
MDLVGKLALTDNGNQYICVIIDYMTKWPQAYPLKSKAAREVADCLLKFVHQFEAPKRVLTDQGKEFVNTIDTSVEGTISIEELTESAIALNEILKKAHVNTRASQERPTTEGWQTAANFLGPYTVTFLDGKSADLEDGRGVKFQKINVDHLRLHIEEVPRIPHKLNPSNSVTVASSAPTSTASPPLEPSLASPPPVPSPASQPPLLSSESSPPVPSPASLPPVPSPASSPQVPLSESLPPVPSLASLPPVPSPVSPPPVPSPVSSPPVPSPASLPPVPSPASSAQMPSPASSPQMPSPASPPPVPSPVSSPPVPSPASLPPVPSPASSAQMPSPASSPASPPPVPSPVSSPPVPSPASLPPVPSPAPPPPVTSPASSAQMPSPASSPQMPSPASPPPVPSPVSSPPVPSPASLPPVPSPASSAQMPSPASSPASPPPVPSPVSSPPVPSPASLPPVPSPAPPPPVTSPASSAQMPSPTSSPQMPSPASPPPAYLPPVYVVSSASSSPASTQPAHATTASSVVVTSSGSSSSDVESRVKDAWGREGLYVLLSIIGPFKLFYSDIHRTAPTRHIESEVLNAYMYHLVQKYNMQSTKKAVSIDSFEMSNMWKYKKAKVKMDPKTFQFIFGIINEHCHWTLTIMIPQENRALFLDPLGETSKDIQKCQNVTRSFMMQKGYDIPGWACGTLPHSRQPDGSSCGAFVLKFAECFLNNEPLHFSTTEESVADLRMTIAACLLQNSADLKDLCQICGEKNTGKNVTNWIGCDVCPRWFHCRCVQRTRKTKSFTCPVCTP